MEWTGTPIDIAVYARLKDAWDTLKGQLIAEVDRDYGIYDGLSFRRDRFAAYFNQAGIPWPRHPSGALALDDETFRRQARLYPQLEPLRQLRTTLSQLRLHDLAVGSDGRNRCLLSPFRSETGRNQPSNSRFIFGPARWIRGLIRPPAGCGLAYIDFSSQEIAIAAALSGDELMMQGYAEGDPYLAFAKAARLAPADATKASHKAVRERCKAVVLGVNYGMGPDALAASLGISPAEANEMMRLHRNTYRRFWSWSDGVVTSAMITSTMITVFGWRRRVGIFACRLRKDSSSVWRSVTWFFGTALAAANGMRRSRRTSAIMICWVISPSLSAIVVSSAAFTGGSTIAKSSPCFTRWPSVGSLSVAIETRPPLMLCTMPD